MAVEQGVVFSDNWAYLKTELNWLDRVLMVAVARHRKETKEVDRLAQSRADRVTSHWWKGVISVEGGIHEEGHKPTASQKGKQTYQQQIDHRIRETQQRGVVLALPSLCDRLQLSNFEKNLVLIALAPEVNRRYARIYQYLRGDETENKVELPTVDLVLRLLCRSDQEWCSGRDRLFSSSPLLHYGLLERLPSPTETTLNEFLRLSPPLIDYLLSEKPSAKGLDHLLAVPMSLIPLPQETTSSPLLQFSSANCDWSDLILPEALLRSLKTLASTTALSTRQQTGTIALLVGKSGTGKTMAAQAIANSQSLPLAIVKLAAVPPEDYAQLLQEIALHNPSVLLIKQAENWLRRSASLSRATLQQFLQQRRQKQQITLLSVTLREAVAIHWQREMDAVLTFNTPDVGDRLQLWQRAFATLPLVEPLDWMVLAKRLALTGGEIGAIAHAAKQVMNGERALQLERSHLVQAIEQQGRSARFLLRIMD
jgi:hypothetical protein